ncbi:hypothetical protein HPB48_003384 [Haemaphysalis longicornis]|uniref:Uncharacterized protein n=1 Tax=Haemaphysalis longicornis TaxID=44386 RepID=A0A9J6G3P3_HAELO|nr:hypothetical protein HPB48_003384 [Haemaphysalis longicornis]
MKEPPSPSNFEKMDVGRAVYISPVQALHNSLRLSTLAVGFLVRAIKDNIECEGSLGMLRQRQGPCSDISSSRRRIPTY